ncbi:hypothetical protein AALB53_05185 [Lachnospiraceae bacterium 47-T17]
MGQVNAFPGRSKKFLVGSLCNSGIVVVLGLQGAFVSGFWAAVTHERSFFYVKAMFTFKTAAYIIALVAGSAHGITDEDFIACIGLFTMESMNAEIMWVIKAATVPCVDRSMAENFLGNGGRILAQEFGD